LWGRLSDAMGTPALERAHWRNPKSKLNIADNNEL
jgi:hypothetical protein